jgi:putative transport protein
MWNSFIDLLAANPLLLLFVVAGIGYPLGAIRVGGTSLGVAAVLFVGLAVGSISPSLKLPELVMQLGLVLFVYTIGLSSGPGFFRALRRGGLRDNALVFGTLTCAALFVLGVAHFLGLSAAQSAGLFAGSLTNTPALAAVVEQIARLAPPESRDMLTTLPTVGYSIAYPMGVLGMIAAIQIAQRVWKPDYAAEARALRDLGASGEELAARTVRVVNAAVVGPTVQDLISHYGWHVVFSRQRRDEQLRLVNGAAKFEIGDLLTVIGVREDLDAVTVVLGEAVEEQLALDRSVIDFRRVFVSNPAVLGRRLDELELQARFGALITRVRRGDMEMLASGSTVLEPGDRVRVVVLRERMRDVSEYLGDSYRALSEIDVLTFSAGLVLGLLLGIVPIPLPGGASFRLGIAGGPLLVALVLGALERSGRLVWSVPYSANLTLRQFGMVLFLAGVGTRAGYAFVNTLLGSGGIALFLAGALVTALAALVLLWCGRKIFRIPMSLLIGMLAGLQTNPAVLSFAGEQTGNDLPALSYATVYPVAMVGKIVLAQVIFMLLA